MKSFILKTGAILKSRIFWLFITSVFLLIFLYAKTNFIFSNNITYNIGEETKKEENTLPPSASQGVLPLDKEAYDKKINELANNPLPVVPKPTAKQVKDPKTGKITLVSVPAPVVIPKPNLWPVKTVYPNAGALLPFNRIVAYYGNLYSTKMGILGQYPEDIMIPKLKEEVKKWKDADPSTPVVPALHYIVATAQGSKGVDGKYRFRMPGKEIDKVIAMAAKINGLVFLDIQVGLSNIQAELPLLDKYLKMDNVHLGIDPEFYMKTGAKPGTVIGTIDASEINYAEEHLAKIVQDNTLTPKILIIHRFTQKMVTNYKNIKILPEVQFVMDMDGWGPKAKKIGTYKQFVYKEPVQFTGFKLFYKNDILDKGTTLFTPTELLKLNPQPSYIQYQ